MVTSNHQVSGRLLVACFFVLSTCFFSCKKKSDDYVFTIDVNPSQTTQTYYENTIVNMTIKLMSSDQIQSLRVSEKRTSAFTKVVLDTLLTTKQITLFWDYQIPIYSEEASQYYLDFDVIFSNGNTSTKRFIFNILRREIVLVERSGQIMYSKESGNASGFDLVEMRAVTPELVTTSSVSFKDTSNSNTLSKVWVSPAGGKFVRFTAGSFDYGNATLSKVQDAYGAGVKLELVNNISEGDVIIYHKSPHFYKLIKLTEVADLDSARFDRYTFSVKQQP